MIDPTYVISLKFDEVEYLRALLRKENTEVSKQVLQGIEQQLKDQYATA